MPNMPWWQEWIVIFALVFVYCFIVLPQDFIQKITNRFKKPTTQENDMLCCTTCKWYSFTEDGFEMCSHPITETEEFTFPTPMHCSIMRRDYHNTCGLDGKLWESKITNG